jgi:hypothetical protein
MKVEDLNAVDVISFDEMSKVVGGASIIEYGLPGYLAAVGASDRGVAAVVAHAPDGLLLPAAPSKHLNM